jgi:hypothetical protein
MVGMVGEVRFCSRLIVCSLGDHRQTLAIATPTAAHNLITGARTEGCICSLMHYCTVLMCGL